MTPTLSRYTLAISLALAALMLATRYHHFGSALHLPDASLAVFFLAGFYLRPAWLFPFYLLEAGLIDYLAIMLGGVSDWCVTPAYGFLIPTYACLWYGGRGCARRGDTGLTALLPIAGALIVGVSLAFLISNGSFYLFSGYFADLSAAEYAMRIARYYPPYLGSALLYAGLAVVLVHALIAARGPGAVRRQAGISMPRVDRA